MGQELTPLDLPLVAAFPEVPAFSPGSQEFDVPQGGSQVIDAGSYGLLKARLNSTVTFTGGVYDFSEWDVGQSVTLEFQASSEIRIQGRLGVDQNSTLLPAAGSGLDAADIVIYVTGINGSSGNLGATPKAAQFGIGTQVEANVYAPNGTLRLRQNGDFTGAFLGKWVILGIGASAEHLSQWTEGSGSAGRPSGGVKLAALVLQVDTDTPTPTNTSVPSGTPTLSETPTPSNTPSVTNTPSPTYTTTPTGTSTLFPTLTPTPPGTDTPTPTAAPQVYSVVIDYTYDPLQRLVAADYSTGEFFHYSYDAVGSRLTQDTLAGTNSYTYDIANRLIEVDGGPYTWDDKGNLLDDGTSSYSYDHANRLIGVAQGADSYAFVYNGLGDRLSQSVSATATEYTLDLAAGLTQVLSDGDNAYLYGVGRIAEEQTSGFVYHHGDALGSVRQLSDATGIAPLARSYEPYGPALQQVGLGTTNYGFTGEWTDSTGLVHLRARYYSPEVGRMLSADPWMGNSQRPHSFNPWLYSLANPVNLTDPRGLSPVARIPGLTCPHPPAGWQSNPVNNRLLVIGDELYIYCGEFKLTAYQFVDGEQYYPAEPKAYAPGYSTSLDFILDVQLNGTGRSSQVCSGRSGYFTSVRLDRRVRNGKETWEFAYFCGKGKEFDPVQDAGRVVAADLSLLNLNIILRLPSICRLGEPCEVTVRDAGGAIKGYRLDMFVGQGSGDRSSRDSPSALWIHQHVPSLGQTTTFDNRTAVGPTAAYQRLVGALGLLYRSIVCGEPPVPL